MKVTTVQVMQGPWPGKPISRRGRRLGQHFAVIDALPPDDRGYGPYSLTHLPTGAALAWFDTVKAARVCWEQLPDVDWSFTDRGGIARLRIKTRVVAAIRASGGRR